MLPNFSDFNSEVAQDKLEGVREMLQQKNQGYIDAFKAAGFDVSGFENLALGGGVPQEDAGVNSYLESLGL